MKRSPCWARLTHGVAPDFQRRDHRGTDRERRHRAKLKTAININGVRFDGSTNIRYQQLRLEDALLRLPVQRKVCYWIADVWGIQQWLSNDLRDVLHLKGAASTGEGELLIGWVAQMALMHLLSFDPKEIALLGMVRMGADLYVKRFSSRRQSKGDQDTSGNAATATKLQTAVLLTVSRLMVLKILS